MGLLAIGVFVTGWKVLTFETRSHQSDGAVLGDSAISLTATQPVVAPQPSITGSIVPYSNAAVVLDTQSGKLLVSKNEHLPVPIASTTKIISAIVLLQSGVDLNKQVTVNKTGASQIGSVMGLMNGETLSLHDLLIGSLLVSGNDAIYTIAENVGGIDTFVAKMNETAASLGMKDSQFFDPAGLNDEGHSSAFDLSIAFRYALTFDEFRKIISTPDTTVTSTKGISHHLSNSNRLIKSDNPLFMADDLGGKTGSTPDAGHTFVTAAERNGHLLIATVLHTNSDTAEASAQEASRLLNWSFDHTTWSN